MQYVFGWKVGSGVNSPSCSAHVLPYESFIEQMVHSIFMFNKEKEDIFFSQLRTHLDVDVVFCYYLIMIQYLNDTHFNFLLLLWTLYTNELNIF